MKQLTVTDQDTGSTFTFYDNAGGTILREFEGFEYPVVRESIEDVSGPRSAVYVTSKFGRRRFSWSGDIVSDTVFTVRRQIAGVLRQLGSMKLIQFTTYDDLALQCEAEIVKLLNPYNHKIHTFLIEAIAPDWRFFSQALHTNTSVAVEQTVENAGNEATHPTYRINGPFTSVTLTNLSTGDEFTIEGDGYTEVAADGEYVEVDTLNRTVKLNGVTSIFSQFVGDFFMLVPGENVLQYVPVGGDAGTTLVTTWRDAYNGI